MDTRRNFANMAPTLNGADGQALQHFMSNWSSQAVFRQIQTEIKTSSLPTQGNTLILDESADQKAGTHNAGASRRYNGRIGKVDLCRVDTCLAYANASIGLWALMDGELFLPEAWFGEDLAQVGQELGIPEERPFETELQLGLKMVKTGKASGLPFELLAYDTFYGRDRQFRADLDAEGVVYAAQVPADTRVYLREPRVGVPQKGTNRGRHPTRLKVLSLDKPHEVRALARNLKTQWQRVQVRHTERGLLQEDFAVLRVWTVAQGKKPRAEWLVMRRDSGGQCWYTLLNAPEDTPKPTLIDWSCRRYFCERTIEDAKTEIGWDEF